MGTGLDELLYRGANALDLSWGPMLVRCMCRQQGRKKDQEKSFI
jgi:hypothetical protein